MARRGRALPNFSLGAPGVGLHSLANAPTQFTFTDETDADTETVYTSNAITVAGLRTERGPASVAITGGTYKKNAGSYVSTPGTVVNGDTITVRVTSSADPETAVSAVLTIGGVSDTYTVTTAAGGDENIPGSDNFADAPTIGTGVFTVDNTSFTAETGEPVHAGGGGPARSAWWKFVAPSTGDFAVSLAGSAVADTVLAVYTGSSIDALTEVASSDDFAGAGYQSALILAATSGATYYIAGDGYDDTQVGLLQLAVQPNDPPYILEVNNQSLTSLDVSSYSSLALLNCSINDLPALDLTANAALIALDCRTNQLTTLDLSANVALHSVSCTANELTALDLSNNPALKYVNCALNQLTQAAVDAILVALDGYGLSGGFCNVSLGTNAAPSATGLAAKASLQGKGWTVSVNS